MGNRSARTSFAAGDASWHTPTVWHALLLPWLAPWQARPAPSAWPFALQAWIWISAWGDYNNVPLTGDTIMPATEEELKKALKAFKKRLKLTQLEEDSRLGHSPLTGAKSK